MGLGGLPDAGANYLIRMGSAGVEQQSKQVQSFGESGDFPNVAGIHKGMDPWGPGRQVLAGDTVFNVSGDEYFETGCQ